MRHTITLGIMVCAFISTDAVAQTGWSGKSNASGGIATYGYMLGPEDKGFDPEMAESETLSVRCDGFDGQISISFAAEVDPAEAGKHNVIFEIDRDRFERNGPIDEGGLYPGAPIALLNRGDAMIEAMMAGYSMSIHVGTKRPTPVMEVALTGSREVFARHLRACL